MAKKAYVYDGSQWVEMTSNAVVPTGSTSVAGVVQLTDSTSSTSTSTAATPNSVKSAYDLANTANTTAAAAVPKSTLAAKGDLIVASAASTPAALPAGTNGYVLTADSAATNGIKWAAASSGGLTLNLGNLELSVVDGMWTGTEYWLCGSGNSVYYATTWDSTSWTEVVVTGLSQARALAFGNGVYIVGGGSGALYTSTNKSTWTSRTSGFSTSDINGAAYGLNGATHTYVVGGQAGKVSQSTDSGVTWTARTSQFGTDVIYQVKYLNGTFIAVGASGKISTSADGQTWTLRTTPGTAPLYNVEYGGGTYIAVGSNNAIYTSTDLSTWTSRTSAFAQSGDLAAAIYNSGASTWMIVSASGRVQTSTNSGVTWTEQLHRLSGAMSLQKTLHIFGYYDGGYVFSSNYVVGSSRPMATMRLT